MEKVENRQRSTFVVFIFLVLAIVAGIFGPSGISQFSQNMANPQAESTVAEEQLVSATEQTVDDAVMLLVQIPAGIESPESQQRIGEAETILDSIEGIEDISVPGPQAPHLVSTDQTKAVVSGKISAELNPDDVAASVLEEVDTAEWLTAGGTAVVGATIGETIGKDLFRAEMIVLPLLILLALWIFRGPMPAILMVLVASLVILLSLLFLRFAVSFVDISVYVMNLAVGLGIGLATDYCLLFISRYREEAHIRGYGFDAVRATTVSAGRTVVFSAVTVALAMSALMLFPQTYFRSMGLGGFIVAALSAVIVCTLLPALLVLLGKHLEVWVPERVRERVIAESSFDPQSGWAKLAQRQLQHPWVTLVIVVGILLLLALPSKDAQFADTDETTLPTDSDAYIVSQTMKEEFPGGDSSTAFLAIDATENQTDRVEDFVSQMAEIEGVEVLQPASFVSDETWVSVVSLEGSTFSPEAVDSVKEIRELPQDDIRVLVGGQTAVFVDQVEDIKRMLPLVLAIVVLVVFLVILLLTGSFILPIKQLLLNALNAAATLGALVWVFQWGNLEWLFNFESHGTLDLLQPVLVAIIAFALATDYGVLLLARTHEHYEASGDNDDAVVRGFAETGRIITSAALLMMLAIGAFVTSDIVLIKILGFGVAFAVAVDAFLMRSFLVPAAMKLLGKWNWWSPVKIPKFSHG